MNDDPEPTGYCLACGAVLLPGLRWCGDACLSAWAGLGAAYATVRGDHVCVLETDIEGRPARAYVARY